MEFKLEINLEDSAFDEMPGYEIARILRELAERVEYNTEVNKGEGGTLKDINGNIAGEWGAQ